MNEHGIAKLIQSKRFWTMLLGLITTIVAALQPDLSENLDKLSPMIISIIGITVGGYSVQDAVREHANGKKGETKPKNGDSTE